MSLHAGPRHPLCPSCRYDLVATVEQNRRICPECGYEFELDELIHQPRPGEWTVGVVLRRMVLHLAVRGTASLVIWSLWMAAMGWLLTRWNMTLPVGIGLAVANVIIGVIIGRVMWGRFYAYIGSDDGVLAAVVIGGAWAAIWLGSLIIGLLGGVSSAEAGFAVVSGGVAATAVLVKDAFFSE